MSYTSDECNSCLPYLPNPSKKSECVVAVGSDNTYLKQKREALHFEEERVRSIRDRVMCYTGDVLKREQSTLLMTMPPLRPPCNPETLVEHEMHEGGMGASRLTSMQ
ncbi:hypothetical protein KC19_VG234800 [Ceratodon purpureus]|uniref:Uncharacterized protein n=1 Tax=Ceratodon purpureus TaxID=3225 RepID=A0A8T0HTI5_CERPU|nr:hypothetical protein KC19_VG234800 [Ceratodon purpureus]